jgi:hypothetical protein
MKRFVHIETITIGVIPLLLEPSLEIGSSAMGNQAKGLAS